MKGPSGPPDEVDAPWNAGVFVAYVRVDAPCCVVQAAHEMGHPTMDNPRPEKVAVVAEVRDRLDGAEGVVLTEYRGLNVRQMAELRTALAAAGGEVKVYKNTMVRFAARELELDIEELLVGPTAIAFTGTKPDGTPGDAVTVAKALADFSKGNDKLVIKGGLLSGRPLSVDEVVALSKIAPREELLARLAGGFAAPMRQFAALLNAVPAKFAYGLQALIDAGGAAGAPAPAAAPEAEAAEAPAEDAPADEATDAVVAEDAADAVVADDAADTTDDAGDAGATETAAAEAVDQTADGGEEQES